MSHNKEIEKKIGVADALIREMESHRDQAKLFQAATEALKVMNKQITDLDGMFAELSSEAIHDRFVALEKQSCKVAAKVEGDSQSLQKRLEALDSNMNGFEKKLQSSAAQSLADIQKLADRITKIDEISNDLISKVIEMRSTTREAIEDTRAETRSVIEQSRDSSCALITSGKDQTIGLLKEENAQIKELIDEQCKRSQKWSIILLFVGLCASGIGGAVLYYLLTFQQ